MIVAILELWLLGIPRCGRGVHSAERRGRPFTGVYTPPSASPGVASPQRRARLREQRRPTTTFIAAALAKIRTIMMSPSPNPGFGDCHLMIMRILAPREPAERSEAQERSYLRRWRG